MIVLPRLQSLEHLAHKQIEVFTSADSKLYVVHATRIFDDAVKLGAFLLFCGSTIWEFCVDAGEKHFYHSFCRQHRAGLKLMLRSFSYSEQRFGSRKKLLLRLFKMLVISIGLLEDISAAGGPFDESDQAWATAWLEDFGGDAGYCRVVGAAVAADCLIVAGPLIKVNDQACADFALEAPAAAEVLMQLKYFLADGGIFLPEASATLTHSVLDAVKERMVWCGRAKGSAKRFPFTGQPQTRQPVVNLCALQGSLQHSGHSERSFLQSCLRHES